MIRTVICDDEKAALHIIQYFIENENLPIQIVGMAENGREALELIKREKPDLAFLDIHMPYLNGFEVIQQIEGVKVIIITAYDSFAYAQRALRMNVCDIISKPIELDQLRQAIRRAIGWNFTDNPTVNTVLAYIHSHYGENIHLEDLEKETFCTESHLSRLFKKYMGETILSYLHRVRIQKAISLLEKGEKSVQEISLEVGYRDLNNFYKYFKQHTGETPAGFHKKHAGNDYFLNT